MMYILVVLVLSVPNQNGPALNATLQFKSKADCEAAAVAMDATISQMGGSSKSACVAVNRPR